MLASERFWAKVNKDGPVRRADLGPCWEWTGALAGSSGYGNFGRGTRAEGTAYAHIWSWEQENGPVPPGLELDHLCVNPPCVRPSHLEAVTHAENMRRGGRARFHREKTHCPQGHPYDTVNTFYTAQGWRRCRACDRDYHRRAA